MHYPKDEILAKVVENNQANGLPDIAVPASQGKFMHLLARSIGAKRILEVGTLGGRVYTMPLGDGGLLVLVVVLLTTTVSVTQPFGLPELFQRAGRLSP